MALLPIVLCALLVSDPQSPVFHLGSHESLLSARFDRDGGVDSGAGILTLVDPDTGELFPMDDLQYSKRRGLHLRWFFEVDGLPVEARALAMPMAKEGDIRLKVAVQMTLNNQGEEDVEARVGARLAPGGPAADDLGRPLHALPFSPEAVFEQDAETWIARDGQGLLSWAGPTPDVTIKPNAESPDDTVAALDFTVKVPAFQSRVVEIYLAGPPVTGRLNEESWRAQFRRLDYTTLQERLHWQAGFEGGMARATWGIENLEDALLGSVAYLRSLGKASPTADHLSDRPFGQPATDAAAEAEIVAVLTEFGFAEGMAPRRRALVSQGVELAKDLSPDRKVAFLHALARAVRIAAEPPVEAELATVIVSAGLEPARVPPFCDPDVVRTDLSDILAMGYVEEFEIPELQWAEAPEEGTAMADVHACRRALAEGRNIDAHELFLRLLARTDVDGLGSTRADGAHDAPFAVSLLTLLRDLLVDDHGNHLRLAAGLARDFIPLTDQIDTSDLLTRFGTVKLRLYFAGRGGLGGDVRMFSYRAPDSQALTVPDGMTVNAVRLVSGGTLDVVDERTLAFELNPLKGAAGLRFEAALGEGRRGRVKEGPGLREKLKEQQAKKHQEDDEDP